MSIATPSLAELAALQGDKELQLKKPLSEGALAEVTEAMRLLSSAGRKINQAQGALEHCHVPFDVQPFKRVQECLDQAWQALQPAMLAHLNALERRP